MIKTPSAMKLAEFSDDPEAFRLSLTVDSGEGIGVFRPDPWQTDDFRKLDRLWMRAIGNTSTPNRPRAWVGRSRGHSKTTDQAMMVMWALAFSKRPICGIVAAAAREQAQILRDRLKMLVLLNPWLAKVLKINNFRVENVWRGSHAFNSSVDIISSDASGNYGDIVDFVICDELTHWSDNTEMWEAMLSTAGKRKRCLLLVMTNAGFMDSWQRVQFEKFKADKNGVFIHHEGPKASWIDAEMLAEQRDKMPSDKAFNRLWMNEWQTESNDSLDKRDILACVVPGSGPMTGNEEGWIFVGGGDLSIVKDRSSFVILGIHPVEHRIRLAYCRSWLPQKDTGKVDLQAIENEIAFQHEKFHFVKVVFDNYQAEQMMQRLGYLGIWTEQIKFQGEGATRMCMAILDVFKSTKIELYENEELIRDLQKLSIENRGFSFKIKAEADRQGHADTAFALAICLPAAVELAGKPKINYGVEGSIIKGSIDSMRERLHNLDKADAVSHVGWDGSAWTGEKPEADKLPVNVMASVLSENLIELEPEEELLVGAGRWQN